MAFNVAPAMDNIGIYRICTIITYTRIIGGVKLNNKSLAMLFYLTCLASNAHNNNCLLDIQLANFKTTFLKNGSSS